MSMAKDEFKRCVVGAPDVDASWKDIRQSATGGRFQRKYRVIVADDFPEHSIMLACAMRHTRSLQVVHTLTSNGAVLKYLLGQGQYADREKFPFPEVLVTELGLPCLETLSLLSEMGTEGFQTPLRVVLTGSPMREHRREAERLGADAFFRKPERYQGLVRISRRIEELVLFTAERDALLKLCGVRGA
jgi:two-component system response regulator